MYEYFAETFIEGYSYSSFISFWFISISSGFFFSMKYILIFFKKYPTLKVHMAGVTIAFTKNFINMLLINISYPSELFMKNSQNVGNMAELTKEKRVNFKL